MATQQTAVSLPDVVLQFCELVRHGNLGSLLMTTALLLIVGRRLTVRRIRVEQAAMAIGVMTFLAVIAAEIRESGLPGSDYLPLVVLQGIVGGIFTLSVALALLASAVTGWQWALAGPLRACLGRWYDLRRGIRRRLDQAREERHRRQYKDEQAVIVQRQNELAAQEDEQRRIKEEHELEAEQKRQRARFLVQMAFDRDRDRLLNVFPETLLQGYFEQYMNSSIAPDLVEQRGTELQTMFDEWLQRSGSASPEQFQSISEIVASFDERRREIQDAFADSSDPFAQDIVHTLSTRLLQMQERALQEFLK